jgi:hypothetical protein
MNRCLALSLLPLLFAPIAAGQQGSTVTGTIVGAVRDIHGGVLPGVTITATVSGVESKAVTDSQGRYVFANLPAAPFTIRATLVGFCPGEERVSLEPGRSVTVDFALRLGRLSEIDWIAPPDKLVDLMAMAQTVAYVRVAAAHPTSRCDAFAQVQATVIEQLKPAGPPATTLTFWQEQWDSEPTPYPVGTEVILFLTDWNGKLVRYGPHTAFLVEGGKIVNSPFTFYRSYAGMRIGDFLRELRAMQRGPRR